MGDSDKVVQVCNVLDVDEENSKEAEPENALKNLEAKYEALQENYRNLANGNAIALCGTRCYKCTELFQGQPVKSCEAGHITCSECICNCNRSKILTEVVYKKIAVAQRLCKYTEEGCVEMYPASEVDVLEEHESSCQHRFQCKMFLADVLEDEVAYCQWGGKRVDCFKHYMTNHRAAVINEDRAVISLPIPSNSVRSHIETSVLFYKAVLGEDILLSIHYYKRAGSRVLVLDPLLLVNGTLRGYFGDGILDVSMKFFSHDKTDSVVFNCCAREPIRQEDFDTIFAKRPHLDKDMLDKYGNGETIECGVNVGLL